MTEGQNIHPLFQSLSRICSSFQTFLQLHPPNVGPEIEKNEKADGLWFILIEQDYSESVIRSSELREVKVSSGGYFFTQNANFLVL